MTPEELDKFNASYTTLNRSERLLVERPWLKPANIKPEIQAMRKQFQRIIDQNIPVVRTENGFKIK